MLRRYRLWCRRFQLTSPLLMGSVLSFLMVTCKRHWPEVDDGYLFCGALILVFILTVISVPPWRADCDDYWEDE